MHRKVRKNKRSYPFDIGQSGGGGGWCNISLSFPTSRSFSASSKSWYWKLLSWLRTLMSRESSCLWWMWEWWLLKALSSKSSSSRSSWSKLKRNSDMITSFFFLRNYMLHKLTKYIQADSVRVWRLFHPSRDSNFTDEQAKNRKYYIFPSWDTGIKSV